MTERPEWLDELIDQKETQETVWEVEQNSAVSIGEGEDEEVNMPKCPDEVNSVFEDISDFLEKAQSDDGLFNVELAYKDGNKRVIFSVDKWAVGVISLDLAAGYDELDDRDTPDDARTSVHITPKIDEVDWPAMFALAGDWSNIDFSDSRPADTVHSDLAGFIAWAYASVLKELFDEYGGLRQKHRTVKRDLEAEIKGSVRISEYITNITRGEATTVPCSFSELTMDNQPNRVLLHALHGAQRLVRDHAASGDTDINQRLLRHRRKFAAVTHERIQPAQLGQLESLPPAFDGYEDSNALDVARHIINEGDLGIETGEYESTELTAVMWELFEDAFAQVVANRLSGIERGDIAQEEWRYQVGEKIVGSETDEDEIYDEDDYDGYRQKQMRPDIYLSSDTVEKNNLKENHLGDPAPIVADTKWKQIGPFFDDKKTVENDDLFQITTYRDVAAHLDGTSDAVGFLVYPCTDEGQNDYNSIDDVPVHQISLIGGPQNNDRDDWGGIYVIGWQVGSEQESIDIQDRAEKTVYRMIKIAYGDDD